MTKSYPGGIEDCGRFEELVNLFEQEEQRNYYYEKAQETVEREFDDRWYRSNELVYGGLMLLLYAWNFAATETKQMDGEEIKDILEEHHKPIERVRGISLLEADLGQGSTVHTTVRKVFPVFKEYFGQTGASKVLSLLNPRLFVMWDEDIRTRKQRSRDDPSDKKREDRGIYFYMKESGFDIQSNKSGFGTTYEDYILYLRYCQQILNHTQNCDLFQEGDTPPAKLLDEALYAFYKIEKEE